MVLVTEIENSLWGVALNGKNHYEHKSERAVHISMAALDTGSQNDQYVPVMVQHGDNSYILCTLHAPTCLQQTLDLELNKGESVNFYLNGNGVVHLTGYYIQEEMLDDFDQEAAGQLMGYPHENCDDEECGGHNGFGEFDDGDEDDEDEDDDDDDDDDDEDEDGEDDEDDDEDGLEFGDEDDEEEDEEEEEEENNKSNGKKRKLETKAPQSKKQRKDAKKATKQESEDEEDEEEEEEEDEPPKLVKANEKQQKQKNNNENKNNAKQNKEVQNKNKTETTTKNVNGVEIKDLKVGNGPEAKKGKYVHVYYQGKLKQNGKQFDACQSGKPFKFRLGNGEVIKGWDIGVSGMKVGGKRVLTIPANLAYGNQKLGGIPPNSTLVFEVELKAVS